MLKKSIVKMNYNLESISAIPNKKYKKREDTCLKHVFNPNQDSPGNSLIDKIIYFFKKFATVLKKIAGFIIIFAH